MRKSIFFLAMSVWLAEISHGQSPAISETYLRSTMEFLASDSLKGRGNYSPELRKAAHFIAGQFRICSLLFYPGFKSFFQPFTTRDPAPGDLDKDSTGEYNPAKILYNVIAYLPADTPTTETIIISAHYDHVGVEGGEVYNGANDDASGTTAVLALAGYFSSVKHRNRNILFCAFAGEELGLWGSVAFSQLVNPAYIIAAINIEMIGIASMRNTFFITGEEYSDVGKIFKKALKETGIKIGKEPAPSKKLFYRSDNFSFALKGIPAHSIMSSDDSDPCYHRPCDDAGRINYSHMKGVIEAIATGIEPILNGDQNPRRINPRKFSF
jgi:hypothetical protein